MTEQEKSAFEKEVREKVAEEQKASQRAYKAEWREKNREHINQYNREYRKNNNARTRPYCRKVAIVDGKGKIIKTFSSITEASRNTGVDSSSITKCCKGELKSAGDFTWRYIND